MQADLLRQQLIRDTLAQLQRPVRISLSCLLRDPDRAADATQEALLRAWQHWPQQGIPEAPQSWLITVGKRWAIDQLRARTREQPFGNADPERLFAASSGNGGTAFTTGEDERHPWQDDLLRLLFTCCHPALAFDARVALTLHVVLDWDAAQVARAFLLRTETMAQRLLRAKKKIRSVGIVWDVPDLRAVPERLDSVLRVIFLLYNEGYQAARGDHWDAPDLCRQALELARETARMVENHAVNISGSHSGSGAKNNADARGLYALLCLLQARADTRHDSQGFPVRLEEQDRKRWNRQLISEGQHLLDEALRLRQRSPYLLLAAINALHADAAEPAHTDWKQISYLYAALYQYWPTPVVRLNQAVAVMQAGNLVQAGLWLDSVQHALGHYWPFAVARAEWHWRSGANKLAAKHFRHAAELCSNAVQKQWLLQRAEWAAG